MSRGKRNKAMLGKQIAEPTPEQLAGGRFMVEDITDKRNGGGSITIGKAYRRKRMLESLTLQGYFTEAEYKAVSHYRHHADMIDRSPIRDSLNHERYGNGNGPTAAHVTAAAIVQRCEQEAGSLADILRAVIVDDLSLSQWVMAKNGAIEQCRNRKGRRVCTLEADARLVEIAKLEIKIAAQRVESELAS